MGTFFDPLREGYGMKGIPEFDVRIPVISIIFNLIKVLLIFNIIAKFSILPFRNFATRNSGRGDGVLGTIRGKGDS